MCNLSATEIAVFKAMQYVDTTLRSGITYQELAIITRKEVIDGKIIAGRTGYVLGGMVKAGLLRATSNKRAGLDIWCITKHGQGMFDNYICDEPRGLVKRPSTFGILNHDGELLITTFAQHKHAKTRAEQAAKEVGKPHTVVEILEKITYIPPVPSEGTFKVE